MKQILIRIAYLISGIWIGVFSNSKFSHPFQLALSASAVLILGMLVLNAIGKARKRHKELE